MGAKNTVNIRTVCKIFTRYLLLNVFLNNQLLNLPLKLTFFLLSYNIATERKKTNTIEFFYTESDLLNAIHHFPFFSISFNDVP